MSMPDAYARTAEFRGTDPAALGAVIEAVQVEVAADLGDERPFGLEGLCEVLVLTDSEAGRVVLITIFDDVEARPRAAAVLDRRPTSQAGGVRVDRTYRVALHAEGR